MNQNIVLFITKFVFCVKDPVIYFQYFQKFRNILLTLTFILSAHCKRFSLNVRAIDSTKNTEVPKHN